MRKLMKTYTEADINAAIKIVETAKQNYPVGWRYLEEVGLRPADTFVIYGFTNAQAHSARIAREDNPILIYCTGWLQGLSIGAALPR
jgi:hypothetical protein